MYYHFGIKRLVSCTIKLRGAATKKSDAFSLFTALQRYYERFQLYIGPRHVFSKIVIRLTLNVLEQIEYAYDQIFCCCTSQLYVYYFRIF